MKTTFEKGLLRAITLFKMGVLLNKLAFLIAGSLKICSWKIEDHKTNQLEMIGW